jgi:hypothetical protein
MSQGITMSLTTKDINRLERVRYFPRQLMTAEDMRTEQSYFVERLRRHNRLLHGWGIVCGLQVLPDATADQPWRVKVCPGAAVAATGDEIDVSRPVWFDLAQPPDPADADCLPCPCPPGPPLRGSAAGPTTHYLAIRYLCRPARPVRTGHTNCGCGDGCETSRLRDDFELGLLDKLEGPYDPERTKEEKAWLAKLKGKLHNVNTLLGLPTRPDCPHSDYPWVILATYAADFTTTPPIGRKGAEQPNTALANALGKNTEAHRRPLLSTEDIVKLIGLP